MNLYFDNATTSYPKPAEVGRAMARYLDECGGSYGRGWYGRVVEGTGMVEECRELVAQQMGVSCAEHVFFMMNATQGANAVLKGLDLEGKRVLVSPMEHNAVMRPLEAVGARVEVVESLQNADMKGVELVVVNHMSNVNGAVQPVENIAQQAHNQGVAMMVDLSQSLGAIPVQIDKWGVEYAIFTGHKSLLAPTGTGGFYARHPDKLLPLIHGGTGSNSSSYLMPESYPDRMEAGTPNMVGLAGLRAALLNRPTPQHSYDDFAKMLIEIKKLPNITLYCGEGELFSLTTSTMGTAELSEQLFTQHGIQTRVGLHCAPLAHRHLGTFPTGTVRIALSPYHTPEDLKYLLSALQKLCM